MLVRLLEPRLIVAPRPAEQVTCVAATVVARPAVVRPAPQTVASAPAPGARLAPVVILPVRLAELASVPPAVPEEGRRADTLVAGLAPGLPKALPRLERPSALVPDRHGLKEVGRRVWPQIGAVVRVTARPELPIGPKPTLQEVRPRRLQDRLLVGAETLDHTTEILWQARRIRKDAT